MIIIFISMAFAVFSLQIFTLNMQIQSLNREIINTPVQLLSKCVMYEGSKVYFSSDVFEEILRPYYNKRIEKYTSEYEVEFYFYNLEDHSYCYNSGCEAVEVSVDCSLINNYHFTRTMNYQIKEGIYGQN